MELCWEASGGWTTLSPFLRHCTVAKKEKKVTLPKFEILYNVFLFFNQFQGKGFLTLCYSADGSCVLAAGQSKHICIYHVRERLLVKKFEVTQNRSFDAMDEVSARIECSLCKGSGKIKIN